MLPGRPPTRRHPAVAAVVDDLLQGRGVRPGCCLDVGFAFKKGTALAPAVRAAVNRLEKDGTCDRILKKWGTGPSALSTSRIGPPELRCPGGSGTAGHVRWSGP